MSASFGADGIAKALGGCIRGTDGWWNAKCPAHADGKASLALKDTDDGSVAYKCMAECDSKAVGDALRARGLLLTEHKADEAKTKARRRIGRTYDYADEAGELLFQVVRYEPKDFRQRRPDPDAPGGWIWKLNGVRRVLYRLPELLAANPAQPVFVVEGEKDVDHLRTLGLVATTSPQGAGKWALSDRGALAGRHVVVLPDNDETGRKHAREVARDLAGKAATVRVLNLPNLPPKGDVSDWLAAGGAANELLQLVSAMPEFADDPAEHMPAGDPKIDTEGKSDSDRWNDDLHRNDRGDARDIIANVSLILRADSRFNGRIRFNEMLEAAEARDLPWRPGGWRPWDDADDLFLAEWCQKRHAYMKPTTCAAAVQLVARGLPHHPVRERLNALVWDGTPRLANWLQTYLGTTVEADPDAPKRATEKLRYLQQVGPAWMISAIARIYEPGCKADHVLILEGAQGIGKSTAAATLALDPGWFADEIADLGTKDSAQDLRGKWVIELGELSAMSRSAVERVKAFISRRVDHYRPSYGRRSQDFPRQCVFIGSTNADAYLGDETGGRRFWPVKVGQIDVPALVRDRDQLWA
ncbi:MAG: VapE domain-containing protein, partial [Geminicoccaceae bacterium]